MIDCPVCKNKLAVTRLKCCGCDMVLEGNFELPRIARLLPDQRQLAEQFILCGGNLKELAALLDISYPTIRRRLDDMIAALKLAREQDELRVAGILDDIESNKLAASEGVRKIKEIQGEI